jgi:hypothetical protein
MTRKREHIGFHQSAAGEIRTLEMTRLNRASNVPETNNTSKTEPRSPFTASATKLSRSENSGNVPRVYSEEGQCADCLQTVVRQIRTFLKALSHIGTISK